MILRGKRPFEVSKNRELLAVRGIFPEFSGNFSTLTRCRRLTDKTNGPPPFVYAPCFLFHVPRFSLWHDLWHQYILFRITVSCGIFMVGWVFDRHVIVSHYCLVSV